MSIVVTKPRALGLSDAGRAFRDDVVAGLLSEPKRLPPKYFYDQIGSELFQRITTLP
jgi:L-histidine N-alpha-methyltransferase